MPGLVLVEAAGQLIHIFQYGLDYSFTCRERQGRAFMSFRVSFNPS
jgi:hypothetical protein